MDVTRLTGVSEALKAKLVFVGVNTIQDLLTNFPRRYEDYSEVTPAASLRPGRVCLKAAISNIVDRRVRRGMHLTEAVASDDSGSVRLIWFNQPYRSDSIKQGEDYFIVGTYGLRRGRFSIVNPSLELVSAFPLNAARIVPVYRETKGLNSRAIRKITNEALGIMNDLPEHLPGWLHKKHRLMPYGEAIREMHFPTSAEKLAEAQRRLGFEEIFRLSLAALLNKYEWQSSKSLGILFNEQLAKRFVASLPFQLTSAQRKVVWQIFQDMTRTIPMNRLIEGDVGSGKTVVAAMAALMALSEGFQVALMAPTEILARQHAASLANLLTHVDYDDKVALLLGKLPVAQKNHVRSTIADGRAGLIVGTQSLLQTKIDMHNLGLIIVDEQHRFGVDQRKKLQAKAGHMPHVLHLTATPIPRSLALTLYGELDISVLDELPPTRQPVITRLWSPNSRAQLYDLMEQQIKAGRQLYVVCPLITATDLPNENSLYKLPAALSAEEMHSSLSNGAFKHRRIGLLHGRLKSTEKDRVMQQFVEGALDILVCTTVIEVGVDVSNASVMVIEGAERFGLAQLHQLRGRVGRGDYQSYCYLLPSDSRDPGPRLRALETLNDGFKLAELDLEMRGPGAIYGTLQHGALDLRVAKLGDTKLIAAARGAAQEFIERGESLLQYRQLATKVSELRAVTNLN